MRDWVCIDGVLWLLSAAGTPVVEVPPNQDPVWREIPSNTGQTIQVSQRPSALLADDPEGLPLTYTVTGGALPPGLTLGTSGVFGGAATGAGAWTITVTVTDTGGLTAVRTISLTVQVPVPVGSTPHLPNNRGDVAAVQLAGGIKRAIAHYIQSIDWSESGAGYTVEPTPGLPDYPDRAFLPRPDSVAWTAETQHIAYGGFYRDRPLRNATKFGAGFKRNDLVNQFTVGRLALLDGMFSDNLGEEDYTSATTGAKFYWKSRATDFVRAAEQVGQLAIPMTDTSTGESLSPSAPMITNLKTLWLNSPSAWKIDDDQPVWMLWMPEGVRISTAEARAWTDSAISQVRTTIPNAIMGHTYQRTWTGADCAPNWRTASYVKIINRWGNRIFDAPLSTSDRNFARDVLDPATAGDITGTAVDRLGKSYAMYWITFQDNRPDQVKCYEASGFDLFLNGWDVVLNDPRITSIQIPTWNDFREGACICPSYNHGYVLLDLLGYWIEWWKTGSQPVIVRDTVYLAHRRQHTDLQDGTKKDANGVLIPSAYQMGKTNPARKATKFMTIQGTKKNEVQALVFLTEPATVELSFGGVTKTQVCPAGITVVRTALVAGQVGKPVARIVRNNTEVLRMVSAYDIKTQPLAQDLDYYFCSSGEPQRPASTKPWQLPAEITPTVTYGLAA